MEISKKYLQNLAKKNRKHNKGMSFFTNTNAGNVELNQAMFNHAMDINGDFVSSDGGNCVMSESLDADTLRWLEQASRVVDGVYLTVKDEDYFLIVDGDDALNELVAELGLNSDEELDKYIDWGYADEWYICDNCGRAVRTQGDSYFWKPYYWVDENSSQLICGDCVKTEFSKEYLESLENNPKHANTILEDAEIENCGYTKLNAESYENGYYGKADSPEKIFNNALEENPDGLFIFSISSQHPFETMFDLWAKNGTYSENDRENVSESTEVKDNISVGDEPEEKEKQILNEDVPHRTVADALKLYGDSGCDVGDDVMDYMWFMNYEENPQDGYDKVQNYIAENTEVEREDEDYIVGKFYDFCLRNLDKFAKFMEENCSIQVEHKDEDDDVENCLAVIEDLCVGNYSEDQYQEFLDIFSGTLTEDDDTPGYKKYKKTNAWKEYKTYDGKKIDRVISSTLTDDNGKEVPIAKLFFGEAPDSIVLKGDEAKKYADNWQKMYPDDTDKYKEYAENQGRYISIHEGSENEC